MSEFISAAALLMAAAAVIVGSAALGLALLHFRARSLCDAQRTERILGSRGRS